jgi:hypothetical protein
MNRDDESLLSAFLDGELDTPQRLRVEAALLEDPALVERLQELAAVRSLVGGLPRPTVAVDLAPAVCGRIEAAPGFRLRRALRSGPNRARLLAAGAGLAAAAALLVAIAPSFAPRPSSERPMNHESERLTATHLAPARPTPIEPDPDEDAPGPAVAAVSPVVPDDAREIAQRDRLRGLLDTPSVARLMILVDELNPAELARVEGALNETGRAEPVRGELTIGQGIVVDPEQPGQAVVYVVVMDDRELADFRRNLRRQGAGTAVKEDQARPEVVTQLADLGPIRFTEGTPVPGLKPPPDHISGTLAKRDPTADIPPGGQERGPENITAVPEPDQPEPSPPTDPSSGTRRVYLVWVTARTPKAS